MVGGNLSCVILTVTTGRLVSRSVQHGRGLQRSQLGHCLCGGFDVPRATWQSLAGPGPLEVSLTSLFVEMERYWKQRAAVDHRL